MNMKYAKEAKARIKINQLLQDAGWRFFDNENGKANIVLESNTKITQKTLTLLVKITKRQKTDLLIFTFRQ